MSGPCPHCGAPPVIADLPTEDMKQLVADMGQDQHPDIARLMHDVFNNPKGRKALATLVARQFFFYPEILTARQLSLRNGAGIMLHQLGIGATMDSIADMIEAGMPPLPKEGTQNE